MTTESSVLLAVTGAFWPGVNQESTWLLPTVFGIGSALPVLVFGILLTLARETATHAFAAFSNATAGWLLVAVGIYLITRQWVP